MLCQDIMKTEVECVSPSDAVQVAAKKMRDRNVGFLPVCSDSREIFGTLTDRDIAIRLAAQDLQGSRTQVRDIMTNEIVCCRATDDVQRAEQLMAQYKKSRILCVDGSDKLCGVISLSDIAQIDDDSHAARTFRGVTERESRASF